MNNFDKLLKALDSDKTNTIMKTSKSELKQEKNDVLQQLHLSKEKLKEFHERLKNYRYIDNIDGLESGHYIRWINIKDIITSKENNTEIKLYKGGHLCDINIYNEEIYLIIKPIYNHHFKIKMSEIIIFKQFTDDELLILSALKYVQKK